MSGTYDIPPREIPLTRAQQQLIEDEGIPIVLAVANRLVRTRYANFDDMRSAGHQGAVDAVRAYDSSLGRFGPFAWPRILGAAKNALARERKQLRLKHAAERGSQEFAEHTRMKEKYSSGTEEEVGTSFDTALDGYLACLFAGELAGMSRFDIEAALLDKEAIVILREAMATLRERDRMIIQEHYLEEIELKTIREEMGVSEATMGRYHHTAMARLGARIRKRYEDGLS